MTPSDSQDGARRRDDAADLRERLAAIEHERWADWQRYMHGQCRPLIGAGTLSMNQDWIDALVIPSDLVERWERQIATPYADLSETEKDSDRQQVDRYWPLVAELLAEVARPAMTHWSPTPGEVAWTVEAWPFDLGANGHHYSSGCMPAPEVSRELRSLADRVDREWTAEVERAEPRRRDDAVRTRLLAIGPTHYDNNGDPNTEYAVWVGSEVVGRLICTPAQYAALNSQLRADVARLEAERDEARMAAGRMRQARNEAQAQCRAFGPLVEAVLRFAEVEAGRTPTMENCSAWLTEQAARRDALIAAVDQTAPSSPLETPQTADGGEAGVVEGAGGSEAAEGSHMDCPERCEVPAGVHIVETPPAGSDVVRCRVERCEKTFLVILDA